MNLRQMNVWDSLQTISLEEMDGIRLMNRVDTKYLVPEEILPELLERIRDGYRVQMVEGQRLSRYQTTYYDTPGIEMYRMHHNRRPNRKKVRVRTYVDSSLSFLEVKMKNCKGRTTKERIVMDSGMITDIAGYAPAGDFVESHSGYATEELTPQIFNHFDRATLVNLAKTERLTIDGGLYFFNYQTGRDSVIPGLIVVELKQDSQMPSLFKEVLAEYRILPHSFSKYCIGTALTNAEAKQNRFKSQIRYINKLTNYQYVTA